LRNYKHAVRRHCVTEHQQEQYSDSDDCSNIDLCNIINISHDAHNIIISKRQEHEEVEVHERDQTGSVGAYTPLL
jgi:hypothetical protein